jgi:hypothetical protein
LARTQFAPIELAEVTRRKYADKQRAQAERKDVTCCPRMENTDVRDKQVRNYRVAESPKHINRC